MRGLFLVLLALIAVAYAKQHYVVKHAANLSDPANVLKSKAKNAEYNLRNNGTRIKYENRNLVQEFAGGSGNLRYQFIALVYNKVSQTKMGVAAALNKRWAICSTYVIPADTPRRDIRMYTDIYEVNTNAMSEARRHRVKKLLRHPQENGNLNAIMLVKGCPSFKSSYSLAVNRNPPVDTEILFYNFMPSLQAATKGRAENCECDELPGWDPNLQICMTESDYSYNTQTEVGSLLVYYELYGIGITGSSESGESYTDLTKYQTWILGNIPEED